ncbi:MAG TPA: ABC transporter permease, partial [Solirubrobacteraceae bacterium]
MTRSAKLAAGALTLLAVAALVVPLLAPRDPLGIDDVLGSRLVPPLAFDTAGHWHLLGTDRFGRDLFVRMMLAGRLSLAIGVGGSVLAAAIGTGIGALSAWTRGLLDRAMMGLADTLLSLPRLVLLLLVASLWRPGAASVVVVLAATGWMGVARLVRAEVLGVRSLDYVRAAGALGVPGWRVLLRHVLPNAIGPAIVATTLGVGNAIVLESGLAFLGLGVQPPHPSWGNMISGGRDLIVSAPWVAITPGLALIGTVLASTVLGDALRDRLAGGRGASLGE